MKMATAAVLFIKPDNTETISKNTKIVTHLFCPTWVYIKSAKTSKKPVLTSERLRMNIAPIVITALLLNPLNASSIVMTLNRSSIPVAAIAVTSKANTSKIKNVTSIANTIRIIIKSKLSITREVKEIMEKDKNKNRDAKAPLFFYKKDRYVLT
tara:strand:- start:48 stop:509 length:462 start_codon:yes stop_codon:yes gene_type:complete